MSVTREDKMMKSWFSEDAAERMGPERAGGRPTTSAKTSDRDLIAGTVSCILSFLVPRELDETTSRDPLSELLSDGNLTSKSVEDQSGPISRANQR